MRVFLPFSALVVLLTSSTPAALSPPSHPRRHRHELPRAAFIGASISSVGAIVHPSAFALETADARPTAKSAASTASGVGGNDSSAKPGRTIVYRPLSIDVDGVKVPVAAWHPSIDDGEDARFNGSNVTYEHRISVSKIGRLLAGWRVPSFVDRNFSLRPSAPEADVRVIASSSGNDQRPQLPESIPVILLAHGYLGSRFDLSHLGEALAAQGFLVLSPEYPESLAASYDAASSSTGSPIDRTIITDTLLETLTGEWSVLPTACGILGHSLGCGTADRTGDESWTRVCLAGGYPSLRGPNCLFVGSINDGAVAVGPAVGALREYGFASLDEDAVRSRSWNELPPRSYLIFGDPNDAPNHISFLAEGTNDAMVEFLSPLLPVTRALGIAVDDFDRYQASRDSARTGEAVVPLVVDYFGWRMTGAS